MGLFEKFRAYLANEEPRQPKKVDEDEEDRGILIASKADDVCRDLLKKIRDRVWDMAEHSVLSNNERLIEVDLVTQVFPEAVISVFKEENLYGELTNHINNTKPLDYNERREIVLDILESVGANRDFWANTQQKMLHKGVEILNNHLKKEG